MSQHLAWYVARATGIVSYSLLAVAVVCGLMLSGKPFGRRPTARWLLDLHRFVAALSVVFVGVHVAALVADSYTKFGLREIAVPFASTWKPVPVALGIVSMYLLLAVELSSLVMRRLPRRLWRLIHFGSFGAYWLAAYHFVAAGTDARNGVMRGVVIVTSAAVLFLSLFRALAESRVAARRARPVLAEAA